MGRCAWLRPVAYAVLGGLLMLGLLHGISSPAASWQCSVCTASLAPLLPQNLAGARPCTFTYLYLRHEWALRAALCCCCWRGGTVLI